MLEDGNKRYIAVSDLHIGLESDLDSKGITIRSNLVQEMSDDLLSIVDRQKATGLVLLGDIKNSVGSISKQEWDEIPAFFQRLGSKVDVYMVPGNHDGNISHLLPDWVNVVSSKGMVLGDTLFVHGHSMPSDLRAGIQRIVMGHLHPVFAKKQSVLNGQRVWVYLQVSKQTLFSEQGSLEIIIVPSFNKYLYFSGEKSHRKSLSPIISRILDDSDSVSKCIIATLDGSIVGDESVMRDVL